MKHYSDFWLGNYSKTYNVLDTDKSAVRKDYMKLASSQRAISNFVNIVTGKSIPVQFKTRDSKTDGKTITIASNLDGKNFDPVVGLALHEGSHILLSNFALLPVIGSDARSNNMYYGNSLSYEHRQVIKALTNVIEDRRIDKFVMTTAPGYTPYYQAMYNEYFHSKSIDKAMLSKDYAQENWDSYMFHIINMTNKNRNLDVLEVLREAYEIIDLANIERLETTDASWRVATEVFNLIEGHLSRLNNNDEEDESDKDESDNNEESSDESGNSTEEDNSDASEKPELTLREKRIAENAHDKQKKFLNGDIKKSSLSKKDAENVKAIQQADVTEKSVGNEFVKDYNSTEAGYRCVVVNRVTNDLIESGIYWSILSTRRMYTNEVQKGLVLGQKLGRKLQVRNDDKSLKYTRLNSGRIDSRRIAAGGYGAEDIFSKLHVDRHTPVEIHISIDASGSMSGDNIRNTITSAVAIAKAASMTQNMEVIITTRGEHENGQPLLVKMYDSKRDNIKAIHKMACVNVYSSTPESLCFEAIMDDITSVTKGCDKYFINFSDGMPGFRGSYGGKFAVNHVRKMIGKMRASNIKVLSFYISAIEDQQRLNIFKKMYGKDAATVNVTQIVPLAKSINKMFI